MADKTFTEKQREVIARRMGYDGPMQMFDEYLKSSPNDARKFGLITDKFMARGGMVKMAEGGTATTTTTTEEEKRLVPIKPQVSAVKPTLTTAESNQIIQTELAPTQAPQVTAAAATPTVSAAAPTVKPITTTQAVQAAPAVETAVQELKPAQGTVSEKAQVEAAQAIPTETAVGQLDAAQGLTRQSLITYMLFHMESKSFK